MDPSNSNSSSFEDLAKDNDIEGAKESDDFMDILGNKQLTKKVCQVPKFHNISIIYEFFRLWQKASPIRDPSD